MNEKEALFQAILSAPEDDAPRLIFADWLEEHGEPERAEFIRLQIELVRQRPRGKLLNELKLHISNLLREHRLQLMPWLPPPLRRELSFEFRRGFLEHIYTSTVLFLRHARELFRVTPLLSLRINQGQGQGDALARISELKQLTELNLGSAGFGDSLQQLFSSAHFPHLTDLDLQGNHLGQDALRILLASGRLSRLQTLDLGNNVGLTDDICRLISNRPELRQLRSLSLYRLNDGPNLSGAGVSYLSQSPHFAQLRSLDLSQQAFGTVGGNALAEALFLGQLEVIKLAGTRIMNDAAIRILHNGKGKIRTLNLSNCVIDDRFIREMANMPESAGLRHLNLAINNVRDRAVADLCQSPYLAKIISISLGKNPLNLPARTQLLEHFGHKVKF